MALNWGGQTFNDVQSFSRWLAGRGTNYNTWAAKHPGAAAQLSGGGAAAPTPGAGGVAPPNINDFLKQIMGEGIFASQNAGLQAENAASGAERQAAVRALLAQFGGLPAGFRDQYGDVDSGVLSAAAGNPYSTVKQLDRQRAQSSAMNKASSAARGVLDSGGYGLREADIGYDYGLGRYNATNQLLAQLNGINSGYASGLRRNANQFAGLGQDAIDRLMGAGMYPNVQPAPAFSGQKAAPRYMSQASQTRAAGMGL